MSLDLYCWILGDEPSIRNIRLFTVDSTTLGDHFRSKIRERYAPRLNHVPEENLVLWKVSFAKKDLEKEVEHIDLSRYEELPSDEPFGDLFQVAPRTQVHIIIQITLLSLNCLILGEDYDDKFTVNIQPTQDVSHLQQSIKASGGPRLKDIHPPHIDLWKVSLSFDQLTLGPPKDLGPKLGSSKQLSSIFSSEPIKNNIHVVVQIRGQGTPSTRPPPSSYKAPPSASTNAIGRNRKKFCSERESEAPSLGAKPKTFINQKNADMCIACNRPFHCSQELPLSLLHRVFGDFLDDAENYVPTPGDAKFLLKFVEDMVDVYDKESLRQEKILKIFDSHLGTRLAHPKRTSTDKYQTDGDIQSGKFKLFITEFKNEIGSTGAEPFFQSILYFLEATRGLATQHLNSVLPCLIVIIFGPYITFAGGAWTDRPTVQMLSPAIPCHFQDTNIKMEGMLMRHLGALRNALRSLDAYYQEYTRDPDKPKCNPTYPYPTIYHKDSSEHKVDFVYHSNAANRRNLFFGQTVSNNPPENICIKFVPYYGKEGHEFLAAKGLAPKLHAVERLSGGLFMVVMDDVSAEYDALFDMVQRNPDLLLEEHLDFRCALSDNIHQCLEKFHQAGFVHGDVRSTNVMVKRSDTSFLLVDYDFCGKAQQVRYPLTLNTSTVKRPTGAVGGMVIDVTHDLEMLNGIWERSSFFPERVFHA